jgi:hypothetical protein
MHIKTEEDHKLLQLTPDNNHSQSMDNVNMLISHITVLHVQNLQAQGYFSFLKIHVYCIIAKSFSIKKR